MYNCQLLVDLAGRNALWGAAAHLFEAFKPLGSPHNPPDPLPAAPSPASTPAQTPSVPRASSRLQRGWSGLSHLDPRKGSVGAPPAAARLLGQNSHGRGCCVSCSTHFCVTTSPSGVKGLMWFLDWVCIMFACSALEQVYQLKLAFTSCVSRSGQPDCICNKQSLVLDLSVTACLFVSR